jgi:hypothetical protein
MAVNYSTATKAARMAAVVAQIDAGSSFGKLQLGTALMATTLATITLSKPCGTVTGAVLTLAGFPKSDTGAAASGTPVAAQIVDSDNNVIVSGLTVGVTSGDVRIDAPTITAGQTVTISSPATITHAT